MTPRLSGHRSRRPSAPRSGHLRVSIERLALHGFNRTEAHRVAAAIEAELARLAARPGQVFVTATLPAGTPVPVHYQPSPDAERNGRAAAQALWAGISGSEEQSS